ncbi:MAG: hypothetical protein Fur007_14870 [Rhodoferax sp.]
MASLSSISVSGMQAAQAQLRSSAHNIANLQTPNFRRQEVLQTARAQGGVSTQTRQAATPGESLVSDVVNQLQAKNAFVASAQVFKRQTTALGSLLNIKA